MTSAAEKILCGAPVAQVLETGGYDPSLSPADAAQGGGGLDPMFSANHRPGRVVELPRLLGRRVRARRVSGPNPVKGDGQWHYYADHGGTVANSYGFAAVTETSLTVVSPNGDTVQGYSYVPANKATRGGAAKSVLDAAGDYFYGGRSEQRRRLAAAAMQEWHAQHMSGGRR